MEYITVNEIASAFKISVSHVYRVLVQLPDEEIARVRIDVGLGSHSLYRYRKDEVLKLFESYFRGKK